MMKCWNCGTEHELPASNDAYRELQAEYKNMVEFYENDYAELYEDLYNLRGANRLLKTCIKSMISKGAQEPYINGTPISQHDFWSQ